MYLHFADEGALLAACDAHFRIETRPPDPASWSTVADPSERLRTALVAYYEYYRRGEELIANAERDAPLMPALAAVLAPYGQRMAAVRENLGAAWIAPDDVQPRLRAAIGHALRFDTWRSLVRGEGLDDTSAADLMVDLVRAAAGA